MRRVAALAARFTRYGVSPSAKNPVRPHPHAPKPPPPKFFGMKLGEQPIDLLRQDRNSNRPALALEPIQAHIRFQQRYALDRLYPSGPGCVSPGIGLIEEPVDVMQASSTLKKRRLKMNKHKYRKRRKRDRRRSK